MQAITNYERAIQFCLEGKYTVALEFYQKFTDPEIAFLNTIEGISSRDFLSLTIVEEGEEHNFWHELYSSSKHKCNPV
jgi:hypothetical protein